MHKRTVGFLSVSGAILVAAVSACGTSSSSPSSSSGGGGLGSCKGTISVATDLPLTGGDATDGPFPQRGAQLAVEQANSNKTLGGCTLNYISKDDASVAQNGHDPAAGAQNMTALAQDQSVVGVVGPFNSSVALTEIPVASQNHLAMISPANTSPCLTVLLPVCSDPSVNIPTDSLYKGPHTYFRVIATDNDQSQILAYIATKVLNVTKVYTIDDQQAYGRGLAVLFDKYFQAGGGTVVGTSSLPSNTKTYATQMSDAQSKGAQLIFFGGTSGDGCGLVRRDMGAAGLNIPMLGGDGCQDKKFITDANSGAKANQADDAQATSAPDVTKLSSSTSFYAAYAQRFASDAAPYNDAKNEPYSPYGYDAMNILVQAIKAALTANGGQPMSDSTKFRDSVVSNLRNTAWDGALGHTTFDKNGDTTNTGFTLYKVTSAAWATVHTYAVDSSGTVSVKS
ncbi:MAG: branched-chain amino acid ABC transporter substrate-binding protein [Candidatus Dormibacteria bacterium]